MGIETVDWTRMEMLALDLRKRSLSMLYPEVLEPLENIISGLHREEDWKGLLRLRKIFAYFVENESYNGQPVFRHLANSALEALQQSRSLDPVTAGRYYHQEGHYLHKIARHSEAISAFRRSEELYSIAEHHEFQATESYYMTALCYRALNQPDLARQVLRDVLNQTDIENLWRAHPLTVLSWLEQDAGNLEAAEVLLVETLDLHRRAYAADEEQFLAVVQTLADLGEVRGILGKRSEAEAAFDESLRLSDQDPDKATRQIGRTTLKYAQYYSSIGEHSTALQMLHNIEKSMGQQGGHFDSLWKIKVAEADVYFRIGKFDLAIQNALTGLKMRQGREMSNARFIFEYIWRIFRGIGPRR